MACPASVTVCEDCIISPGVVGTLSPSDSDSVGPVGPYGTLSPSDSDSGGTLSSSDLAGILFPAIPAGMPFPVDPVGPVGQHGTLSPSDSDYVGTDGTLSSFDLAGILFPAVPAGIPFPVGPVGPVGPFGTLSSSDSDSVGPVGPNGTLSPSDFEYAGPAGTVGTSPPCDNVTRLFPIFLFVSCHQWILFVGPLGIGPSNLDRISGREGSCYYTVACRSAGRGLQRCRGYGWCCGQLSGCSGCG